MSAVRRRDRTISDSAAYNKRKMIAVRGGAQVGPVAVSDSLLAKQTARSDFRENETGQPTVESRPRAYSARQVDVTGELREWDAKRSPPKDEIVSALFQRLVDKLNLTPDRVAELNLKSKEQKWQLILAQHELRAGVDCVYYVEQLVRHIHPMFKEKKVKTKFLGNLRPLRKLLSDLEVDLRSRADDEWIQEFINPPNNGHIALFNLLKDFMEYPVMPSHKNPKKQEILARGLTDLYTALLCIKALMGHRRGFTAVLNHDTALLHLVLCMKNDNLRVKAIILKLMILVLLAPQGNKKILQAFTYFYTMTNEVHRWRSLIVYITKEPIDPVYQSTALTFINTVVQTAATINGKVYLQHDFLLAGLDPEAIEKSLGGRHDERVLHELREWNSNFLDISQIMDDLAVSRGGASNLKEKCKTVTTALEEQKELNIHLTEQNNSLLEVNESQKRHLDNLRQKLGLLKTISEEKDLAMEQNRHLSAANEQYLQRTSELKDFMSNLMEENRSLKESYDLITLKLGELGHTAKEGASQENELTTLSSEISIVSSSIASPSSTSISEPNLLSDDSRISSPSPPTPPIVAFVPPPPPPGAPPPPPPLPGTLSGRGLKQGYIPKQTLVRFHWTAITNPTKTIFRDIRDARVIGVLNFKHFESLFEARKTMTIKTAVSKTTDDKVSVLDPKQAENLVIAKRRIGYPSEVVKQFILNSDLDGLWGEQCDLLLKFIPSKEEQSELAKYAHIYERFGEAEKYLFQLSKVDRYAIRLSVMSFMSSFDELYHLTYPKAEIIMKASLELFRSARLKKIFEVILAFGNYMNSTLKGVSKGFKLESLDKLTSTKSHDRNLNLLNYIVHVIESVYPHASTFSDEIPSIEEASHVSLQLLAEDVQCLRDGIKLANQEMERQPKNFIIFSFCSHATEKVHRLTDIYKRMDDAHREVCVLFDEDPHPKEALSQTKGTFYNFFSYFQRFSLCWKNASAENEKLRHLLGDPTDLLRSEEDQYSDDEVAESPSDETRLSLVSNDDEQLLPRATLDPSRTTLEPSRATLDPSRTTLDPSRTTLDPSRATLDPSRTTLDPSRTTLDPSRATLGPSRATLGPSRATLGPSRATLGPSRTTLDPSRATLDPSRVASDTPTNDHTVRNSEHLVAEDTRTIVNHENIQKHSTSSGIRVVASGASNLELLKEKPSAAKEEMDPMHSSQETLDTVDGDLNEEMEYSSKVVGPPAEEEDRPLSTSISISEMKREGDDLVVEMVMLPDIDFD